MTYRTPLTLAVLALSLSACTPAPKTLYSWGGYQREVYGYLKSPDADAEFQLLALDQDHEKARARNGVMPPGYHAHRGLLHARLGRMDQAAIEFQAEKRQYPESAAYMDFLLSNKQGAAR